MYNKVVHIYRVTAVPSSAMFEVSADQYVLVNRNIQARIGSGQVNDRQRAGGLKEPGFGSSYKNKLFVPAGTDIKVGDRVIEGGNTSNRYIVDYVNDRPGGLVDHHIECLVSSSEFMVAS